MQTNAVPAKVRGFNPKSILFLLVTGCAVLVGCATSQSPRPAIAACCQQRATGISTTDTTGSISDVNAEWETDSGGKIKLGDLNGHVRVISMFYATCQGVCVITKQDMQAIEASLPPAVREQVGFILVTLDARRDTAEALHTYRQTESLSPTRWTLLRGDEEATGKLAALLGIGSGRDSAGRFIHSSELVVLDQAGRVIHRHSGLRADLQAIAGEIEAAASPKTGAATAPAHGS